MRTIMAAVILMIGVVAACADDGNTKVGEWGIAFGRAETTACPTLDELKRWSKLQLSGDVEAQMRFQIESDCSGIKRGTEVMAEEHSVLFGEQCVFRPRGQTQCEYRAKDLLLADALCVRPRGETRCRWTNDLIKSKAAFEAEKRVERIGEAHPDCIPFINHVEDQNTPMPKYCEIDPIK
jgi:hypothetical protein